jgi:hypothetical protein
MIAGDVCKVTHREHLAGAYEHSGSEKATIFLLCHPIVRQNNTNIRLHRGTPDNQRYRTLV